jgi:malonate-semialdehyde dehydrogenase (acetylating)/methylmalonate-semialdehyde dehydrogenase
VTCSRNEAELLLSHPDVAGVTFVGSTSIGRHIYANRRRERKTRFCLCEAKNHALVLADAPLERTVAASSIPRLVARASGAWRCRSSSRKSGLPTRWLPNSYRQVKTKKIGPAYNKTTDLARWSPPSNRQSVV